MIRIAIENVFFFLLPTLVYFAWVAFRDDQWMGLGRAVRTAPIGILFIAGAMLMLATLTLFSSESHNSPTDVYVPPEIVDGKLQPGHSVHTPEPEKP